jgi:competence protein ComEA
MSDMIKVILSAVLSFFFSTLVYAGAVNINTADAESLASGLVGVGESKAIAIVEYRKQNGPFASADDLASVKGIGDSTVEKNRDNITVE